MHTHVWKEPSLVEAYGHGKALTRSQQMSPVQLLSDYQDGTPSPDGIPGWKGALAVHRQGRKPDVHVAACRYAAAKEAYHTGWVHDNQHGCLAGHLASNDKRTSGCDTSKD
jgi:hypothetical protein